MAASVGGRSLRMRATNPHFRLEFIKIVRESRTINAMRTVVKSPTFQKQASKIWDEFERFAFIEWIANFPLAGDVIPGAEGARKVRWATSGQGKRGGARVIYFNLTEQGVVYLVAVYAKADQTGISAADIRKAV